MSNSFRIYLPLALFFYLLNALPAGAQQPKTILPLGPYLQIRDGLNHSAMVFNEQRKATVAFLGGSITFGTGWRDSICAYLSDRYPLVKFHFIAAGIPSLGSLPHAFRLQRDVLDSGVVDLLFIETAVNDRVNLTDSLTQVRALEGIVRHARKANPKIDMVLMSFADPSKTADYQRHIVPAEIANHEMIAGYYRLPSINLAKQVHDQVANGEYSWENDFKDLHPSPFGHEVYFRTMKKLLDSSLQLPSLQKNRVRQMPKPIDPHNLANGRYYAITNASHDAGWRLIRDWTPDNDISTRAGFVHQDMLVSVVPSSEATLHFSGTAVGIAIVSGPDAGFISYSIDGRPFKMKDLYTEWSAGLYLPWYILFDSALAPGRHILKIRTVEKKNDLSKGNACRIVYFLVNGK